MLRDNLVGLIEPMLSSAGANPLALCTERKRSSDDRPPCLENSRPEGAESTLTENAPSPFHAEPKHSLDPQLVCYSWMTGIPEVAQVVFVRKRLAEVQYLRTTITDEQREEFGRLVGDTIQRIESAQFLPHSGIRFPQNPCSSCPYVGLLSWQTGDG